MSEHANTAVMAGSASNSECVTASAFSRSQLPWATEITASLAAAASATARKPSTRALLYRWRRLPATTPILACPSEKRCSPAMRPPSQLATPTLTASSGGLLMGSIRTTGTPAAERALNWLEEGSTSTTTAPADRLRSTRDVQSWFSRARVMTTSSPAAAASYSTPVSSLFIHVPSTWFTTSSIVLGASASSRNRSPALLPRRAYPTVCTAFMTFRRISGETSVPPRSTLETVGTLVPARAATAESVGRCRPGDPIVMATG